MRTAIGYITLATASVPRDGFPRKYVCGLPPCDLPLILLARLAVDRRFAGRGLGHALISVAARMSPGQRPRIRRSAVQTSIRLVGRRGRQPTGGAHDFRHYCKSFPGFCTGPEDCTRYRARRRQVSTDGARRAGTRMASLQPGVSIRAQPLLSLPARPSLARSICPTVAGPA